MPAKKKSKQTNRIAFSDISCPGEGLNLPTDKPDRYPTWSILGNPNKGLQLISADAEGKDWTLSVNTGSELDISVLVGRLDTDSPPVLQIAEQLASFDHPFAVEQLLTFSPYWLDQIKKRSDIMGHKEKGKDSTTVELFYRKLILFRLVEICLAAIGMWHGDANLLRSARLLLLRQRYRYLAWMAVDRQSEGPEKGKLERLLPHYEFLVRQAQHEWGEALLKQSDEIEFVLSNGLTTQANWDMDREAALLIQSPNNSPWFFAVNEANDLFFTDQVIQGWFLARDDLSGATRLIAELATEGSTRWPRWLVTFLVKMIHPWAIFWFMLTAAILILTAWRPEWLEGMLSIPQIFGLPAISPIVFLIFLALIANVPVALVGIALWGRLKRIASYPFALRVPAMGVVGILAIAGLADAYSVFSLNAWRYPWLAFFLLFVSVAASFAYIFFEAQARTRAKRLLCRVTLLWSYSWASTFWLALFLAFGLDAIGVSTCQRVVDTDLTCSRLWSDGTYRMVLEHFIEFGDGNQLSIDYVFLVSALALLMGVFTQIFWEDKSIAEPL